MPFDTRFLVELRVLTAVVDAGTFVRAGESLGLTQSAISRAVQRLEQQLKVRLFQRSSRAVTLTDEGRRLYEAVRPLLEQLGETIDTAGRSGGAVRGRLRINVDAHFARLVLAPNIGLFLAANPELSVEIVAKDQLGDLVADGFDAAVRFGHPEASTLMARKLLEMRIVTCAAPDYLARRGIPVHPRDLEKHRHECLLFRDPATRLPFTWEFHRRGKILPVNVSGQLVVNDGQTLIAACLAGVGIAQMFDWGLADHFSSRRLVNLFPSWTEERWPLYAYHLFRHHSPAKIKAFMDFIAGLIGGVR